MGLRFLFRVEFLMNLSRLIVVALVLMLVAGCSNKYRLDREQITADSPWPFHHGTVAATGSNDGTFDGRLTEVWAKKLRGKPAGPLTIYNNQLIFPGSKKYIEFYDLATGDRLGKYKSKGYPLTGLVMADSVAFYSLAWRRNRVEAIDLVNRKKLWRRPLKDATAGSIILDNSLFIGSADGILYSLDLKDGADRWRFESEGRFTAALSAGYGLLFQPAEGGKLLVISVSDGELKYAVTLEAPIVAPVAVGDLIYAGDIEGQLYALSPDDGSIVWTKPVGGPIWSTPALSGNRVLVSNSAGYLVALDATTGSELWRYDATAVIKASPLVIGNFVVVVTMAGMLTTLELASGTLVDKVQLDGAISTSPVTDGKYLMVATERGKIRCYGRTDE